MSEKEQKESGRRLTQSEWLTLYLLDTDDVPEEVVKELFFINRHLELTNISRREVVSYKRKVRDILRVSKWSKRRRCFIPYQLEKQIEFFTVDVLLKKSIDRGERELLATEIKELRTAEIEKAPSKGIRATVGKIFGGGR